MNGRSAPQPAEGDKRRRPHRRSIDPAQVARTRRIHIAVLLFVVLWAYVTALAGDFVWSDDRDLLQGGQRLLSMQDLAAALLWTTEQYAARLEGGIPAVTNGSWQPTVILSYTVSWMLFRDCSFCHHFENLLWHGLVVLGLYALGRHVLNLRRHGPAIAFWAAFGFAVHPLGVSSVGWVGGRPVLLVAALSVWSLVLFSRLPATSKSHRKHINRWQLGIAFCVALALGADERAFMLPFAALLIAWFESRERGRSGFRGMSQHRRLALLGITAVSLAIVFYRGTKFGFPGFAGDYPGAGLMDGLGTALRLFWTRVYSVLLPGEPIVSDAFPVTTGWDVSEFAALAGLIAVIAATVYAIRHHHPLGLGLAWFLLWGLPGSGVFPLQRYYHEASLYPAYWGLMFGLAYVLFQVWRPLGRQMVRGSEAIVFGPILILTLALTASSNVRWHSDSALFESEINNDPHYREGRVMLAKLALDRRQPEIALNHGLLVEQSREDKSLTGYIPEYQQHMQLGRAQLAQDLVQDARLSFAQAVAINPVSVRALQGLAAANIALGENSQAEASLRRALALWPNDAGLRMTLGELRLREQRYEEAYDVFLQVLADGRSDSVVRLAVARARNGLGQYELAESDLRRALAERDTPSARAQLAWTLWRLGREDEARSQLEGIQGRLAELLSTDQYTDLRAGLAPITESPADQAATPETEATPERETASEEELLLEAVERYR